VTLNYVGLTLDLYDGQGNPVVTGAAYFTPTAQLTDAGVAVTTEAPIPGVFHSGGLPVVSLLATDNTAPQPNGWGWQVTFSGVPGNPAGFTFELPYTSGSAQNLSSQTPVASASAFTSYVPAPILVAAPTGATAADTPAIATALAKLAAGSGYGTLIFQDGTYQVDSNALVIRNCSNFTATSAGATVITQAPNRAGLVNNTTGNLMVIADSTDFRVEKVTFDALRDSLSPITALTATASSGQPSVTVASGQGSRYLAGQFLYLFGGLGTGEQNQAEGFGVGSGTPLVIQSISPGGGSGGGDKITFTTNLTNSYAQISSTVFSDGYGPYAYAGAYLTPYQCGSGNSVAGRTLSGEDQQNGLHLLSCKRFSVDRVESRNIWESGVKCGSLASTALTDGCTQGDITDCITYHGYDQGISLWVSSQITVKGCVANASGWAGISLSAMTDNCVITGNQILNSVYRVPGDVASGSGISIEGGRGNQVKGNVITGVYGLPYQVRAAPFITTLNSSNAPTTSTALEGGLAAGTSVQVSSSTYLPAGTPCSILDRARTEALTIATVVDGTHVTFVEQLRFSHASGVYVAQRFSQENTFEGNTIYGSQTNYAVNANLSARGTFKGNTIRGWAAGCAAFTFDITTAGVYGIPSGAVIAGDGSVIEGNTIWNALNGLGMDVNGAQDMVIKGNYFNGPNPSNGSAALFLGGVTDSVIEGNHFSEIVGGQYGSWAIWVAHGGSGSNIVSARLAITGNKIRRAAAEGIYIQSADSLTVTGNVVTSCGGQGGITLSGVTHSQVMGNICNSNQAAGICVEDNGSTYSQYNEIIGNTCRDDGSGVNVQTSGSWTQQYGINETGHSNNNLYAGNTCDSNGTGQLVTVGADSYEYGNMISGAPAPGNFFLSVNGPYYLSDVEIFGGLTMQSVLAMGGNKITGVANGSAGTDVAAYGQLTTETSRAEAAEALLAPLASPALTGTPTAPTQTTGDNTTKIATDAFVATALALKAALAGAAFTGAVTITMSAAGSEFVVKNNTSSPTAPTTQLAAAAAADSTLGVKVSGETNFRMLVDSNGKHQWGAGGSSAVDTDLYRSGAGALTTDGALTVGGVLTAAVSGQYLCAPTSYAPASPVALTATSTTLAALSSASVNTGSFTAPASGSVLVTVSLTATMSAAGNFSFALAAHGGVTPVLGNVVTLKINSGAITLPYTMTFLVTGLTSTNNFDLLAAAGSTLTLTVDALGSASTTPTGTLGGPVTMTVQGA
jgi:parallel beta-helix repeat protein